MLPTLFMYNPIEFQASRLVSHLWKLDFIVIPKTEMIRLGRFNIENQNRQLIRHQLKG